MVRRARDLGFLGPTQRGRSSWAAGPNLNPEQKEEDDGKGIRKRGSSYEAWVYDKRTQRKIRRSFTTEAAAKGWRADAQGQVRRLELRPQTKLTIEEAWDRWLEGARGGSIRKRRTGERYKPGVVRSYGSGMKHVIPDIGAVRVSELTRFHVQALVDRWLAEDVSGSAVRNRLMPLRAIYRQQIKAGAVTVNPLALLELPDVGDGRDWTGSTQTAALIIAAVPEGDRALWGAALLQDFAGANCKRLAGSTSAASRSTSNAPGIRQRGSSPRSRRRASARCRFPRCSATFSSTIGFGVDAVRGSIFGQSGVRPFDATSLQTRADKAFTKHGLERVTLHVCRHGYRSFLDDIPELTDARRDHYHGHSSNHVSRRYTHALLDQIARDAQRIHEYLTGASTIDDELEPAPLSQN